MKKLLLIIVVAFILNGCRYINTTEPYLKAEPSTPLVIPEGVNKPNASSTLEVPKADNQTVLNHEEDDIAAPPDMPLRTKQTEDGKLRISSRDGYPVLSVKIDVDSVWKTMNQLDIENWSIENSDEDNCIMMVHYEDQDARDRENSWFIKKIFTRNKYYTDYSGDFNLKCKQVGSIVEIKFTKKDGSVAKSFLADGVMNNLYGKFK